MNALTDAPTTGALPIDPNLLAPTDELAPTQRGLKRKRRSMYRPSEKSLYHLMYQNAGSSLFVRPLFWTDKHCEILGAQFEELPPCDTPVPKDEPGTPPSRGHMRPSPAITLLSDSLTEILLPSTQSHALSSNAIKTVLETLWPSAFGSVRYLPELHIYFGGRVYRDTVRVQAMWNFLPDVAESYSSFHSVSTRPAESFNPPAATSSPTHNPVNLPMMCYIGKNQLAAMRKNIFRVAPGPKNSWNEPVWRLQQLRSKMLLPLDDNRDPHLVGVFLAMAQRHIYGLPPPSLRREHNWKLKVEPTFYDIKLRVLTNDNDTSELVIYTATVTAAFLRRFHDPFSAPLDSSGNLPGIHIEMTRVPIWPILGLRERLGKALGSDIVGQFDPEDIETWNDSEDEDTETSPDVTRKRRTFSEVFNDSFEGDTSDDGGADEPALSAKKRCLREGSVVGVVR